MNIKNFKLNPNNPRVINDQNFKKLVKSIKDFPEMLEKRPIVCVYDEELKLIPLGGNQRLKALMELGYTDIPDSYYMIADDWDENKQKEFIIKDNNNLGEWDIVQLETWDLGSLKEWGLSLRFNEEDYNYSTKSDFTYNNQENEGGGAQEDLGLMQADFSKMLDTEKYEELLSEIENGNFDFETTKFLRYAVCRFLKFDYSEIAKFYISCKDEEIRKIFRKLALVIDDLDGAIKNGFILLNKKISKIYDSK